MRSMVVRRLTRRQRMYFIGLMFLAVMNIIIFLLAWKVIILLMGKSR
jgi:hypothetical protein